MLLPFGSQNILNIKRDTICRSAFDIRAVGKIDIKNIVNQ